MRTILLFVLLGTLRNACSRDASYAAELRVPFKQDVSIIQRLVSLPWLRYLNKNYQSVAQKKVWIVVQSLPEYWQGRAVTPENESTIKNEIGELAKAVLSEYMTRVFLLGEKQIKVLVNEGVDEEKVVLDILPYERYKRLQFVFNRTVVITFENPPYGQSKANRLVTNRNIAWHNDQTRREELNQRKRIDKTDLRYRYYHNIGHLLGFGHFVSIVDKTNTKTDEHFTSVMFADTEDFEHASQILSPYDVFSFYYIVYNLDDAIQNFAKHLLEKQVAKEVLEINSRFSRYVIT